MTRILVVDDEPQILRALRINLRARQYEVSTAASGAECLHSAASHQPDLILLDLGLPDIDGVEVVRRLRAWTPVPIVILSGRLGSHDKVAALDAGADDYVTKPFGVEELLARVRAVTRRHTQTGATPSVHIGQHTIDLSARTATRADSSSVHLTPIEWELLEVLIRNAGRLVTQRHLLQQVWGTGYENQTAVPWSRSTGSLPRRRPARTAGARTDPNR